MVNYYTSLSLDKLLTVQVDALLKIYEWSIRSSHLDYMLEPAKVSCLEFNVAL